MSENTATDVRVAIVGVGNCASRSSRACSTTRTLTRTPNVPGPMHAARSVPIVRDVKFVAALTWTRQEGRFDLSEAIFASRTTLSRSPTCRRPTSSKRFPHLDGIGKYYAETIEISDADVDVVKVLKDAKGGRAGLPPAGGFGHDADKFYARQCHRCQRRVRQRAAGLHRQ